MSWLDKTSKQLIVNGYLFENETEYKNALEEKKSIDKVMKKLNLNNKELVLGLYNAIIDEGKFSTVVGMEFLCKLRGVIIKQKYSTEDELQPIPLSAFKTGRTDSFRLLQAEQEIKKIKESGIKNKDRVKGLTIACAILCIVIGVMMYITSTSDNVNVLNYERKLRDKYSAWEIDLNEREQYIKEVEKKYNIKR